MWLMIILKITKNEGFIHSLEDKFLENPQSGSNWPPPNLHSLPPPFPRPSLLRVKVSDGKGFNLHPQKDEEISKGERTYLKWGRKHILLKNIFLKRIDLLTTWPQTHEYYNQLQVKCLFCILKQLRSWNYRLQMLS